MKIIYFAFIFFNKYNSMAYNYDLLDENEKTKDSSNTYHSSNESRKDTKISVNNNQNIETKENNTSSEEGTLSKSERNKYAKIIYSFAITSSLLTLGFTIWNYLTANNEDKRIGGLILNAIPLAIDILYIIFFRSKKLVLKLVLSFYALTLSILLLIDCGFIMNGNGDEFYGNLTGNYEYNIILIGIMMGNFLSFFFQFLVYWLSIQKNLLWLYLI